MDSAERQTGSSATAPVRTRPGWGWFASWAAVGGAYAFSLLAMMSIGIFILPIPIVATIVLARRPAAGRGLVGLVAGGGLPALYVAWLNRSGPGMICSSIPGGQTCSQEWNPWPWFAAGLVLIIAGVTLFVVRRRC